MAAGRIYRGEFYNVENKYVKVDILDHRVPDAETSTVVPLELTDVPVRISSIDNNEDPFTQIIAQQATIEIFTTSTVSLADFSSGPDEGLECIIYYDDIIEHHGFISLRDNSVPFLAGNQVITLTSSDGLGRLKSLPLLDFTGINPQGVYKISEIIAMCLLRTGLYLKIRVINTLGLESVLEPFYDLANLDVKTFEADIGESENCYLVLEKILGKDSRLFQYNDQWWIIRVADHISPTADIQFFDEDGEWQFTEIGQSLRKRIGFNEPTWFADEQTNVSPSREIGKGRLNYKYENPKELVCNIDLSRGTGPEPDFVEPEETADYEPDCLAFHRSTAADNSGLDGPPFAGSTGLLQKKYVYGYEEERYLLIENAGGFAHYFTAQPVDVVKGDILEAGISFRFPAGDVMTNVFPMHIRIVGDDGFFYDWDYDGPSGDSEWVQKNAGDSVFTTLFRADISGQDSTQWFNVGGESKPVPASGKLYIRIYNGGTPVMHFSDIQFDYKARIINGSFGQYTGHYHQVNRDATGYNDTVDDDVFINDAPRKVFKGALLLADGDDYVLSTRWLADGRLMPYGWHQVYSVWNAFRNAAVYFEFNTQGLGDNPLHLRHRIEVMDISPYSINRIFLLLNFEKDLKACSMNGTFCEVFRTDIGRVYTDPYTFKYIT